MKKVSIFQSKNVIQHKWDHGVYSLNKMIDLVETGNITKEDFFTITRYNYDGVINSRGFNKQH